MKDRQLDSWEILGIFIRHYKIFAMIFVAIFGVSLVAIKLTHKEKIPHATHKLENPQYFSFLIYTKTIENNPIVSHNTIKELAFLPCMTDSNANFPLISKIENHIFKLSFLDSHLESAEANARNLQNCLTQSMAVKIIQSHLKQLQNKHLDSANKRLESEIASGAKNIFEFTEVYFDTNITNAKIAELQKHQAQAEKKRKEEQQDFVQTSFRSKIILAFIASFIIASIAVFIKDFWDKNRHKIKR